MKKGMRLLGLCVAAFLLVGLLPAVSAEVAPAGGTVLATLFGKDGTYPGFTRTQVNIATFSVADIAENNRPAVDVQKDGRIKVNYIFDDNDKAEFILHGKALDTERDWANTAALSFWTVIMANPEDFEIGITCDLGTSGRADELGRLTVPMEDVADMEIFAPNTAVYTWQKVTIPLSYFKERGTFSTSMAEATEFNWNNVSGLYIACINEEPLESFQLMRLADAVFEPYLAAPSALAVSEKTASNVTLTWTAPTEGTVTGYDVYRDGTLLDTVTATTYTDTLPGDAASSYVYAVQAKNAEATSEAISRQVRVTGENTAPTATITSPAREGQFIQQQKEFVFSADVTDDGTADRVEFYLDDADSPFATATQAPFEATWTPTASDADAAHTVKVIAYDDEGLASEAVTRAFTVSGVTIAAKFPADGALYGMAMPDMYTVQTGSFFQFYVEANQPAKNGDNQISRVYVDNDVPTAPGLIQRTNTYSSNAAAGYPISYYAGYPGYYRLRLRAQNASADILAESEIITVYVSPDNNLLRDFITEGITSPLYQSGSESRSVVEKSTEITPASGTYSTKVTFDANAEDCDFGVKSGPVANQRKMFDAYTTGEHQGQSPAFLQFWVYLASNMPEDFAVYIMSGAEEAPDTLSLPLAEYVDSTKIGQWQQIVIPLTEMKEQGTVTAAGTYNYDSVAGVGFTGKNTTDVPITFYLDNVRFVTRADEPEFIEPEPEETAIVYRDQSGAEITSLAGATQVTATADIVDAVPGNSYILITAVYQNDVLAAVKCSAAVQAEGTALSITGPEMDLTGFAGCTVRSFLWDSLASQVPYLVPAEIK